MQPKEPIGYCRKTGVPIYEFMARIEDSEGMYLPDVYDKDESVKVPAPELDLTPEEAEILADTQIVIEENPSFVDKLKNFLGL